jgi:hypothetical protein
MTEQTNEMTQSRRPAVIWIAGIGAVFYALIGSWMLLARLVRQCRHQAHYSWVGFLSIFVIVGVIWLVSIGLFRRWKWSRWFTVVLLVGWVFYGWRAAFAQAGDALKDGGKTAYLTGSAVVGLMILVVSCLLVFQAKVARYFSPGSKVEQMSNKSVRPSADCNRLS